MFVQGFLALFTYKMKKCFALENIIHMPELKNLGELSLSRPGDTFVTVMETLTSPAQFFQWKNTQVCAPKCAQGL